MVVFYKKGGGLSRPLFYALQPLHLQLPIRGAFTAKSFSEIAEKLLEFL
jgi:hypothetical protein